MNRLVGLLLLASLTGCSLDVSDSPAPRSAGQWIFHFDLNGHLYVGGYTVDENDLPELVKQWHVTSALVQGSPGSNFKDAVKIENELKAAGVANVSIADQVAQ